MEITLLEGLTLACLVSINTLFIELNLKSTAKLSLVLHNHNNVQNSFKNLAVQNIIGGVPFLLISKYKTFRKEIKTS